MESDERLRRLIRDVLQEQIGAHGMTQILLSDADALIAAINASGIAWVAPWEPTETIARSIATIPTVDIPLGAADLVFWTIRDAHLAEQEERGR